MKFNFSSGVCEVNSSESSHCGYSLVDSLPKSLVTVDASMFRSPASIILRHFLIFRRSIMGSIDSIMGSIMPLGSV